MPIIHKFKTAWRIFFSCRSSFYNKLGIYNPASRLLATRYLYKQGVMPYLVHGVDGEFGCGRVKHVDLANLYRIIRRKKPYNVIEFGCGFSSIAMAHALKKNGRGKLHIVEASSKWAENVRVKLEPFKEIVEIYHSAPRLQQWEGQICHIFDRLPDVRPDLIYLDGPDPDDIEGNISGITIKGLTFQTAADPLLYEWSFYPGFKMVVDGRYSNTEFLKRNLKRKYKIKHNWLCDYTVFELLK